MKTHISFRCRCGRILQVSAEHAGTQIRCWDCQARQAVPHPDSGGRLARECLDGARDLVRVPTVARLLLGALAVSSALMIPVVGAALGLVLLTLAAVFYLETFRRGGVAEKASPTPAPRWSLWAWRGLWAPALALGFLAPVLLRHAVMDRYGYAVSWRGVGIAAASVACWLGIPLALLGGRRPGPSGLAPAGRGVAAIRRHPLATGAAVLSIPAGLVLLEAILIAVLIVQGWFGFFVLDLFPGPGSDRVVLELTDYSDHNPAFAPLSFFARPYVHGLKLGYTLTGSIPASLPRGPALRARPWFRLPYIEWYVPGVAHWYYPAVRVLYSTLILTAVGLLLAIQARWLGLVATVDTRPDSPSDERERPWDLDLHGRPS